ncbi:MAG: hypothetical protein E7675_05080 [Ruminococcaceae bacterium]|nr:hypothetical protein [Oscillospiraceae bacterium]
MKQQKLHWLKLDNAAKIYPAAKRRGWINFFRLSVTLSEKVDPAVLQNALDAIHKRFPSICARLCHGLFWYYLEEMPQAPIVREEGPCPLITENKKALGKSAIRVIYYDNRIAVEYFHSITDGTGGMVFLKSLVAEYIHQRYGAIIPYSREILDPRDPVRKEELEDCFQKHEGRVGRSRNDSRTYKLRGTKKGGKFLDLTCGELDSGELLHIAHDYEVSVTEFLCAVMLKSLITHQNEHISNIDRQRPVKVLIPVNLRRLYGEETLRNFSQYITPGIDPRLGEYTLRELAKAVHHHMGEELTPQKMSARIKVNTDAEKSIFARIPPLFIKNLVMRAVYDSVGETTSCLNISNLGIVRLPEEMAKYVDRFDFIIGPPASTPNNCSVVTYKGKVYINFIRNIKESELERIFFTNLVKLGLHVKIQSNQSEVYI